MARGKFGGESYKPKQLGAEPSPPPVRAVVSDESQSTMPAVAALLLEKVPESIRIPVVARERLRQLREDRARRGEKCSKDGLYLEALNLLFKKYGLEQIE
jgi:hypothetical protein